MDYVIYTFHSSVQAMKSELILESEAITCRLVPLLPEIDAGCGLALRFNIEDSLKVEKIFKEKKFKYQERYILTYVKNRRKPVVKEYDIS